MASVIPIVANRKNCRRSNPGAVLVGLLIFVVFGVIFFLFSNRSGVFGFNFSIVFWIGGFMIFAAIILAAFAVMMSRPHNISRNRNIYKQQNVPEGLKAPINPYKVPTFESNNKEVYDKEDSVVEIINYCRYCGAERRRRASRDSFRLPRAC